MSSCHCFIVVLVPVVELLHMQNKSPATNYSVWKSCMNCSLNWLLCIISIYTLVWSLTRWFVGYPIWCKCGIFLLLCCFYVICLWLNSAIIYMLGLLSFVSFSREGGDYAFTNILILVIIGCPSICLPAWLVYFCFCLLVQKNWTDFPVDVTVHMSCGVFFNILFLFVCIIDYDIYRLFWSKHKFLFSFQTNEN